MLGYRAAPLLKRDDEANPCGHWPTDVLAAYLWGGVI